MRLTLRDISDMLGFKPVRDCKVMDNVMLDSMSVSRPLIDSRSLLDPADTIFFALTTSSNDGHRYFRDLYRRGVRTFVMNRKMLPDITICDDVNYFYTTTSVPDALQTIAAGIRDRVTCPVIGITGSRGKTVVKEMLADALNDHRLTVSPRSWNSQIGVPMSVWRLEPDTELGIFEAGISKPGEMERIEAVIKPTIGIFTGITDEHAYDFESIEQKCREKAKLFTQSGDIIYIANEPFVEDILKGSCPEAKLHRAENLDDIVKVTCSLLGKEDTKFKPSVKVSTRIDISEGSEENLIAFDSFSNDLGGIETALDYFARRIPQGYPLTVVMGDVETRGWDNDIAYKNLEKLLLDKNVDGIIAVGETIGKYVAQFSNLLRKDYAADPEEFNRRFNHFNFPHSAVLIKGKPGKRFELIKSWLEDPRHDTSLEVNLDALVNNFNYYRSLVKPTTGMIGMVKADAYGAGAVEISRTLQSQGVDYLAVAVVEEGLELRKAGITVPIMVLNPISSNYTSLFAKNLEPTVFSLRELELLSCFAPKGDGVTYPIHVKIDTGMHRFGLSETELPQFIEEIKRYPQFRVASIFSHLATADCLDKDDYTEYQLANFDRMSFYIMNRLGYPVKRHVLNTAGIMRYPQYQYDMVRLGIGLYGISPLDDSNNNLQPVSSLVTTISALQQRQPGETVGYGRCGVITRPSTIATLPIGYADGLNRHLGNGGTHMSVNGCQCPTVGNICMDICMIDVTDAKAMCNDRVEIFGREIPVTQVAKELDTIPYEILTSIAPRVKRVYYRE